MEGPVARGWLVGVTISATRYDEDTMRLKANAEGSCLCLPRMWTRQGASFAAVRVVDCASVVFVANFVVLGKAQSDDAIGALSEPPVAPVAAAVRPPSSCRWFGRRQDAPR